MTTCALKGWFISCFAVVLSVSLITGCQESDEQVLRREFDLPSTVKLLAIKSSPEKPGFFGREGLDITAAFQFDPADFEKFLKNVQRDQTWKPMPPDREFLIRMTGIRAAMKGVEKWAEVTGKPVPPLGSVYNPTEDQLYERWVKRLPLDVKDGLYQCKTAGDNLLHSWKKVPCSEKSVDLNDFIFAVLDTEQKVLRIKLHTRY